jgi:hypothetical protein
MPRIATFASTRVFEGLVLQSLVGHSDVLTEYQELCLVGRYEVRHRPAFPHMPVQPEPSVHGVDHPITPPFELPVGWYFWCLPYWHAGTPS